MPIAIQQLIERIISSDEVLAVFVAALLSFFGWIAIRIFVGRSKIAWAFSHQHAFHLQNLTPPVLAYTKEIWIQNVGKVVAEDVEVILVSRPQHYDIWPQRHYSESSNPDGSIAIKFDHLNCREYLTISVLQTTNEPPMVTNVRWKGGLGKQVQMGPRQIFPRWFDLIILGFLLLGFFSFWYFIVRVIWF